MGKEVAYKEEKLANGWFILGVQGQVNRLTADGFYQKGEEVVSREARTAIDLSGVDYLSSAGIRVFLRLLKKAKKEGKEFTAVGAAGDVKSVLEDSNMATLLHMRDTRDDL